MRQLLIVQASPQNQSEMRHILRVFRATGSNDYFQWHPQCDFLFQQEQFSCKSVQTNLDEFFKRGRSGWITCVRLGINILKLWTKPRKDRSFIIVFGASSVKIAEVLLSRGEIGDCDKWYLSQWISNLKKKTFGKINPKVFSSNRLRHLRTYCSCSSSDLLLTIKISSRKQ